MPLYRREGQSIVDVEWVAFLQAAKSVTAGVASMLTENSTENTCNRLDQLEILKNRLESMCSSFTRLLNNLNTDQNTFSLVSDVLTTLISIQGMVFNEVERIQSRND